MSSPLHVPYDDDGLAYLTDSIDYPIDFVNVPKYVVRHIHSLRENLINPLDPDHRDLLIEILILQSSFPLGSEWGCGCGVLVYFEVPSLAAVDVVLRGGMCPGILNLDDGLDRSRAGGRVWTFCYVVLFGGLRRDDGVADLDDGARWLVLGSNLI
jgi:hypothetical protein